MCPSSRIGIAVVFQNKEGKVVVGKVEGSHGAGTRMFPGDHLELGESLDDCAAREVSEETGLAIDGLRFLTETNDVLKDEDGVVKNHYSTIFVAVTPRDENSQSWVLETESEEWEFVTWDKKDEPATSFNNYGPGLQFNASGGTQNNNTGNGNQFLVHISGPVYFASIQSYD